LAETAPARFFLCVRVVTAKTVWNFLTRVGLAEEVHLSDTASEPTAAVARPDEFAAIATANSTANASANVNTEAEAEVDGAARSELAQAMQASGAVLVEKLDDLLDSLSRAIPDDALRHRTALDILAKSGHPPTAVVADFDRCIGVLEEKKREFAAQLEARVARRVGGKVETVESCTTQIRAKEAQVSQLQQEIAELVAARVAAAAAIDDERGKLARIGERFGAAYESILTEVQLRRSKIVPYAEVL
jgi:hypothetical protein